MLRLALIYLCLSAAAIAQVGIGAGLKGGFVSPGWYRNQAGLTEATDTSSGFAGGPYAEIRLGPVALGVEALYRRIGLEGAGSNAGIAWESSQTGSMWRVPVLAKVRLPRVRLFRPFVAAGPSLVRLRADVTGYSETYITGPGGQPVLERRSTTSSYSTSGTGFTIGCGIERRVMPLRITLEGRFTKWRGESSANLVYGRREPNQLEFLFGIGI